MASRVIQIKSNIKSMCVICFSLIKFSVVTLKNYSDILDLLLDEKAGWEVLGAMLGLDKSVLDGIKIPRQTPTAEVYFHKVLSMRMSRSDEPLTWKEVCDALKSCEYRALSERLRREHSGQGMNDI